MTITLTKEEMEKFQSRLSEWYSAKVAHCLRTVGFAADPADYGRQKVLTNHDAMVQWEKENPKPDWRTLL